MRRTPGVPLGQSLNYQSPRPTCTQPPMNRRRMGWARDSYLISYTTCSIYRFRKMSSLQDVAARVGLREETLNQPCEEDHYRSLIKLFQPWPALYSDLLSTTELDGIRESSISEEEKSLLCMQKWKSKCGAEASYDVILRSLLKNGAAENAEAICRQLLLISKQS